MDRQKVAQTVALLDAWFQTMRNADGYCGPVAHWWQSCLLYSGPMIDWRYEGIICGYLTLYQATGDSQWLERALTAGDDIRRAQLPTGQFRNSSFEIGPIEGGTPHEAAADIGLLELARVLRSMGDDRWERYFHAAEWNLRDYHLGALWNGNAFLDQPRNRTLVANKNATTMEALLLYEELSGQSMEAYIRGAASIILDAQVSAPSSYRGATIHLGTGPHRLAIGIYTARCVAALVQLGDRYPDERCRIAAEAMGKFLLRLVKADGTCFGYYPDGRAIHCPTWISPSGDVLRALLALRPHLEIANTVIDQIAGTLVRCQHPSGGIPTARGLGRKGQTQPHLGPPDFRDVLPVAGWIDKAFRALTLLLLPQAVPEQFTDARFSDTTIECVWKGRTCLYRETATDIRLDDVRKQTPLYRWQKGDSYPQVFKW